MGDGKPLANVIANEISSTFDSFRWWHDTLRKVRDRHVHENIHQKVVRSEEKSTHRSFIFMLSLKYIKNQAQDGLK